MRLEKVFGVINDKLSTHVSRNEIDECFGKIFTQKRQLVIYGSSKQGKTTLLNTHISQENKITIQCSPTTNLPEIYRSILKKLQIQIQSSTSTEDSTKSKFYFKLKIPFIAETGAEIENNTGEKNTHFELDVSTVQEIAELIKNYFPSKIIILENFHYLEETIQKLFAFDLRTFQDIDVRVIILGIWKERNRLNQYNGDLQDRIIELPVEPWSEKHLSEIIELGEKSLNIDMGDIASDIIEESFGNVGMLQELCKESCYDAHILKTGDHQKLTFGNLRNAIDKITNSYANRFYKSLESFANAKPRSSQDGSQGLGLPYFFVRVILLSFDMQEIKKGITMHRLREEIKKIHPNKDNIRFDSSLTNFLIRLGSYQKNHGITPSIFDYDPNLKHLSIVDPLFFFFTKHYNHEEFLNALKLPLGYEKNS